MAHEQGTKATAGSDTIPYPGAFDIGDFEKRMGISSNILNQLMGMLASVDAFQNNLSSRSDPTIPALLNSQLGNYARFQGQGGVNANDVLSGNFSGMGSMLQPMSMGGDPNDPFSLPIQKPGGNAMTEQIFSQLLGPAAIDQIAQYSQGLFGMHSPIPALRPQTNRPLPNVVAPNFDDILSQFTSHNYPAPPTVVPAPGAMQQGFMPQSQPPMGAPQMPFNIPNPMPSRGGMLGGQGAPEPITAMPLASFQMGTNFVPQTGNYALHKGEAVVPAQQNPMNQMQGQVVPGPGVVPQQPAQQPAPMPRPMPQIAPHPFTSTPLSSPVINKQMQPGGMMQQGVDIHSGQMQQPMSLPGDPYYPPPPGTPIDIHTGLPQQPQGGAANPLQQALGVLQMQMMSGGPINQNVQNIQQQQLADSVSMSKQQALDDIRARMGSRGLGGSGLQFGLEQQMGNDAMRLLTQGQNQIALDAAGRNYDATGNTANSLIGGSLGAGQFGLNQAQFNLQQSQSMFDQLMQAIRQSYASPSDQYGNQTNVAFV